MPDKRIFVFIMRLTQEFSSSTKKRKRILFLDFARGIAIILMLQGHFISSTYLSFDVHPDAGQSFLYTAWSILRGFTAPLFFTVSGMVFTFALMKAHHLSWLQNPRVRKGLIRGVVLVGLGYLLQLNYANIDLYASGELNDRMFAFHVLNSIGIGIIALILIYIVFIKSLAISPLIVYPFCSFVSLFLSAYLADIDGFFPKNAPQIIQNIVKGPHSIFPIFPWISFIFYGAFIGSVFVHFSDRLKAQWTPILLSLVHFVLLNVSALFFEAGLSYSDTNGFGYAELYMIKQLSYIAVFLSLLLFTERFLKTENILILMGRNTLTIYVTHIILLYGAITGVGIQSYAAHSLSGIQAVAGACGFVVLFALMTYLQSKSKSSWFRLR